MAWSKNKNTIAYQSQGTFTANGSTAVVFAPLVPIGPNSIIVVSLKTIGGTPVAHPYITALTPGAVGTASVSFKAAAGDTSIYNVSVLG